MDQEEEYREFINDYEKEVQLNRTLPNERFESDDRISQLRQNIMGSYEKFSSPYGEKPMIYLDWTASAKSLINIESYIQNEVLPYYGNTHTTTSITGHQSTCFRLEARQIIAECVNAKITGKAADDLVLFCGNGTTSAVARLINSLGLNSIFSNEIDELYRPVVFTSSYEHHSNLLPWREISALMVTIKYDSKNGVDLIDLESKLQQYSKYHVKLGCISAASNVTGILTNVDEVSILLHKYNAFAFFDYATAAPYIKIDMNPVFPDSLRTSLAYKDAVFFSGHKFLGGPGSSGVLVAKRWIIPTSNEVPSSDIGGGTVFYVTENFHRFLSNREEREEAGSPNLLSDIRIGLSFNIKRSLNISWVESRELEINKYVTEMLGSNPRVVLLGKDSISNSLPIFSFLIRCKDKFLHFHFVSVLLNDLFGIQSRGGCMCAGPFSQSLLGINDLLNQMFDASLLDKHEVLRPGFTRISFPFWITKEEIDFTIEAIQFISLHGWKFLPYYRFNYKTGEWAHTSRMTRFPERKWLSNFNPFESTSETAVPKFQTLKNILDNEWDGKLEKDILKVIFDSANEVLNNIEKSLIKNNKRKNRIFPEDSSEIDRSNLGVFETLRWFVLTEDFRATTMVEEVKIEQITGPIRPTNLSPQEFSPIEISTSSFELTSYAKNRAEKIKMRTGNEFQLPRYLTHLLKDESLEKSLINLFKASFHQSISLKSSVSQSNPEIKVPNTSQIQPINSNNDISETIDTTDSCVLSFNPRKLPPPSTGTPPVDNLSVGGKDPKILSGPGYYYPADPSIKGKFVAPPKKIMKLVGQAIKDWNMIEDGDRLLLGLSGGKDSLALLHILKALQARAPVKFEFACATVDPQTSSFDPTPLIPYLQNLGITYHFLSEPIVELAKSKLQGDSLCAFCSRFKRGLLYSCCRNFKYNKLILAQHLDDLVESFMMSALHNGQIRTMKANYTIEAGDVRVIRPLIYVRETTTRDYSKSSNFPIINENCPACFEQPKERARLKKLLSQEEAMVPGLFHNMKRALIPLMHEDTYKTMETVTKLIEEQGTKPVYISRNNRNKIISESNEECNGTPSAKRAKVATDGDDDDIDDEPQTNSCSNGICVPCFEIA